MAKSFSFTEQQKQAIREAVQTAEQKTAGEIVPFFVQSSDDYEESNVRAALVFGILALGIMAVLSFSWSLPFAITPWEVAVAGIGAGVIGYILSKSIDPIRKLFTSSEQMLEKVEIRALQAFLSDEVFNTKDRTGILILVSHFEHMVEVLGDSGVNSKVKKEDWQEVVELIVTGIKNNDPTSGLVNGINKCGELLHSSGVDKPAGNPNELSDDIRLG